MRHGIIRSSWAVLVHTARRDSSCPIVVSTFQQRARTGLAFTGSAPSSSSSSSSPAMPTKRKRGGPIAAAAPDASGSPLLDLGALVEGTVVKRPSATIRSAYVADVRLAGGDDADELALAHAPALDVGGLCAPGGTVLMRERAPGGKTSHSIDIVLSDAPDGKEGSVLVGAHPRLGEDLAEEVLRRGLLVECLGMGAITGDMPKGKGKKSPKGKKRRKGAATNAEEDRDEEEEEALDPGIYLKKQVTYGDSRVDFELTTVNGKKGEKEGPRSRALIEVKNVVCADYFSGHAPEKRGDNHCVIVSPERDASKYERAALFPWGRVAQEFEGQKVVSTRAIKHIRNLVDMRSEEVRPIVLFVVNRSDCERVRACGEACPVFAKELAKASKKGVLVVAFRVRWSKCGKAYFDGVLPVDL